jgi:hypothetical protein
MIAPKIGSQLSAFSCQPLINGFALLGTPTPPVFCSIRILGLAAMLAT